MAPPPPWGTTCTPRVDDELFGSVCLETESRYYAHATKHSNTTAERTALLQAILYLEGENLDEQDTLEAVICSDSEYAIGCTEGTNNGEKNLAMYKLIRARFAAEKERRDGALELLHVKGHSGDIGNDHADRLAWWGKRDGPKSQLAVVQQPESEAEMNERENDRLDAKIQRQREEEAVDSDDPDSEPEPAPDTTRRRAQRRRQTDDGPDSERGCITVFRGVETRSI